MMQDNRTPAIFQRIEKNNNIRKGSWNLHLMSNAA